MTEEERVKAIVEKYDGNLSVLHKQATSKELKTVLKYVADEANRKQRKLIGLDD